MGHEEPMAFQLTIGGLGVCIFFSISGYLVARSRNRSPNVISFATKRLVRIWPGLAAVTLLCTFVLGPIVTAIPLGEYFRSGMTFDFLNTLLLRVRGRLPGVFETGALSAVNGSLWTIPLELDWYVIIGCLGLAGVLKRRWLIGVAALVVVAYVCQQMYTGKPGLPNPLFIFGGCFLIGAALSSIPPNVVARRADLVVVAAVAAAVMIPLGFGLAALYLLVPLAVIVIGEGSSPYVRRAGRFGDFSYGFYLYAFPVQQTVLWATNDHIGLPAALALSAGCTVPLAIASWTFVESPAMNARGSIADRIAGRLGIRVAPVDGTRR